MSKKVPQEIWEVMHDRVMLYYVIYATSTTPFPPFHTLSSHQTQTPLPTILKTLQSTSYLPHHLFAYIPNLAISMMQLVGQGDLVG